MQQIDFSTHPGFFRLFRICVGFMQAVFPEFAPAHERFIYMGPKLMIYLSLFRFLERFESQDGIVVSKHTCLSSLWFVFDICHYALVQKRYIDKVRGVDRMKE